MRQTLPPQIKLNRIEASKGPEIQVKPLLHPVNKQSDLPKLSRDFLSELHNPQEASIKNQLAPVAERKLADFENASPLEQLRAIQRLTSSEKLELLTTAQKSGLDIQKLNEQAEAIRLELDPEGSLAHKDPIALFTQINEKLQDSFLQNQEVLAA